MFRTAQWQQVYGLTVKSRRQPSGLESDLLWDYMMVSRRVGRARRGESLMQGWGGRRSGRATDACPWRLPLSAGSLRLGCGGEEKLADCSTDILLESAVFANVLEESSTLALMSSIWFWSARVHGEFAKWLTGYKEARKHATEGVNVHTLRPHCECQRRRHAIKHIPPTHTHHLENIVMKASLTHNNRQIMIIRI